MLLFASALFGLSDGLHDAFDFWQQVR